MKIRLVGSLMLGWLVGGAAFGQVIVDEDFESYTNNAAFEAAWAPDFGNGQSPTTGPIGILVPPTDGIFPPAPFDGSGDDTTLPPVEPLVGQAIAFSDGGGINEWDNDGDPTTNPFELSPDSQNSIRYSADMFDFVNGNRRFSTGLRHDLDTDDNLFGIQQLNLVELGFWNADATDPTDGATEIPTSAYAYRVVLFSNPGDPLIQNPNWQYFELPIEFDDPDVDHNGDGRFGNGDGLVTPVDVGPGWHTFSATIAETEVTVELDLFRDGTVDASQTWTIEMADSGVLGDVAYFNSLRIGGPSGVAMNEFTMVDNVKLEVVSAGGLTGDFDNNGDYACEDIDALVAEVVAGTNDPAFDLTGDGNVNAADVTAWLAEAGAAELPSGNSYLPGDANLDGSVDVADFNLWNNNKFTATAAWCQGDFNLDGFTDVGDFNVWNTNKFNSADTAVVPEPTASMLILLGALCLGFRRR